MSHKLTIPCGAIGEERGDVEHHPHHLSAPISDYLHANKGDTLTTLFFKGLMKLGIEVEPGDLVPKRQRRSR